MKIAYFGLPLAGLLLRADGHTLCRVVLSPIAAPGRRRLLARLEPGTLLETDELRSAEISELLQQAQPDLIVSWYYTRLIEAAWLKTARLGGIGAHPSLLPRHRGPNPFFWAIDQGDEHTGVSIHRLTDRYDTGAVLATHSLPIGDRNSWQLARALDRPSLRALREMVLRLSRGEAVPETPQLERQATWAREPDGALLAVDWSWPTEQVLRRIRALSPVPGLALELSGVRFFITQARRAPLRPLALDPGEAALLRHRGALLPIVCTADGAITVERASVGLNEPELDLNEGEICSGTELAALLLRVRPHMIDSLVEHTP
jgi:methionyl-tRNA formyltransferase